MNLNFVKSRTLQIGKLPTAKHPQGDSRKSAWMIPALEGSTFDEDTFLVERKKSDKWVPMETYSYMGNTPESTNYMKTEIGTWVDANHNGKMEPEEIRSFSDRLGDTNVDHTNGYDTVTLDLAVYETRDGKYVSESLGILRT